MVFFNYSTMQMAAKVVYYGPGLCGKTTNLQYIYSRTADDSRGEMVSLETDTDRTLFFDLLPIDVGSIAGFTTRIQLYTVPGQVFYNTTRKLVLKGVDGVVFVADSQRPMLQANIDSFKNLEENLAEMGLAVESIPLVLQFNKRDLSDICSVEELNQALNREDWPYYESIAITGEGVFETLKGISRLTLLSLKRRLAKGEEGPKAAATTSEAASPAAAAAGAPTTEERPGTAVGPEEHPPAAMAKAEPEGEPEPDVEPEFEAPKAAERSDERPEERPASPEPTEEPAAAAAAPAEPPGPKSPPSARKVKAKSADDVMAELERIRKQTLSGKPKRASRQSAPGNGRSEISREIQLTLTRSDFDRVQRFLLNLQVEDGENQVVDSVRDFKVDLGSVPKAEKFLLKLNIALRPKE